ncbi:MAG TPA: cupin domain-containing protein [Chloroflexota bacterium]|nr:cupin domain-containing protein [Chloroflexota bacterium]
MALLQDSPARAAALEAYYRELEQHHAGALWTELRRLLTTEPRPKAVPHHWRWAEMRPLVYRAGELIGTEEAERRVVMLVNPGLREACAITGTLYAGLQLILPGEIARSHRHTAAALRFIVEGHGAYTAVDGEKTIMNPGDLVLTPNWTWHDHGNESDEPMVWLDGLDLPLVTHLDAIFFENYPEVRQPLHKPVDDSLRKYGAPALVPTYERHLGDYSPLLNYTWERTRAALVALAAESAGSPYDGVIMEYVNPRTGGPVMPTMGCYIQLLPPGFASAAHRHTSSVVYHVVEGEGYSLVGDQRFDWQAKDVFCVPSWAPHQHVNTSSSAPAILFSYTDAPVLRALGLFREAA